MELEKRLAQRRCIAVSSPDVAEEADDHYWRQALKQRARVCGHVSSSGYGIEVINSNGLRRAMSQVKWPTPNPSGSTAVDLIHGPAADLLWLAVKDVSFFVVYVAMPKASFPRASVLLYLGKAGYDIKLVHTYGFTRAMS